MLQPGYQRTSSQFPIILANCSPPSNFVEGSPSTVSPSTLTLSPNENDIDCDLVQDDVLEAGSFQSKPCSKSPFPLPEELVDFVNSYAFSGKTHLSIEEMLCDTPDLPDTLFPLDSLG
ncbi:unnamed protein product, partial [Hydatigera taeniaeformis]|uniref:Ovule protein n=1 Tax=Hydatigena taeniaeformis TaxID=6205 RepID=A0A0R3XDA9_HYDTA